MTTTDWERFFELIDDIVDGSPGKTVEEKRRDFLKQMNAQKAQSIFEEFHSWFDETDFE